MGWKKFGVDKVQKFRVEKVQGWKMFGVELVSGWKRSLSLCGFNCNCNVAVQYIINARPVNIYIKGYEGFR